MTARLPRPALVCALLASLNFTVQRADATAYTTANNGVANWSSSTTWSPNGVPGQNDSAEIRNGAIVVVDTSGATYSCGNLTIDVGGALENVTTSGQNTLNLYGNLVNSNATSGGFAAGGSSATKITFASGSVNWTGSGDNSNGKFYVIVNSGVTLDISGLTTGIKFKSGSGTTTFTVNGTLVGGTQVINANGNANNTFVLGSGATLKTANPNGIFVGGSTTPMFNYVTAPTLNSGANFVFNCSTAQVTAGLPSAVNNLTISNTNGVTLSAACTVNGAFTLSGGVLKTSAANLLTLGLAASISGAASNAFVSGPLAQIYSVTGPKTFSLGTNGNYRAVTLNMTTLGTSPSTITITPHEPSSLGASALGVPLFTNRDWTVASSASSGNIATLTVDGTGFVPVNSAVMLDNSGSATNSFPATSSWPNYSAAGINLTASSDFALGDCTPPSSAPTNIVVTTPGCAPVALRWNSVNGAASYNVYRKLSGGSYGVAIGNSVATNYSDPTAINGSNYIYAVTAASACGAESAPSVDSGFVMPAGAAYLLSSPVSITTGFYFTPTFSATAINVYSNQWFVSTNGGSVWKKVSTGSGGTTASYTTAFTTTNMSGYQFECVAYGCSGAVTSAPATLTVLNFDQFDFLRQTWVTNLINNGGGMVTITSTATKYWTGSKPINTSPSGANFYLWSDLPLGSSSANISSTYGRLQSMALGWATPGSALQTNAALAAAVMSGLDWMNTNVYSVSVTASTDYGNWYDWEIAAPMAFDNTALLMYPALSGTQVTNYCAALDNFAPDGQVFINTGFAWGPLTGANTANNVEVMALRGILGKSSARIAEAVSNLSEVFPYSEGGDGYFADGSYVFHGNIAYNGHYGWVQLQSVGDLLNLLNGSTWQITDPQLPNIYSWINNGYEPLIYGGAMMDMVRGRFIGSSTDDEFNSGASALAAVASIARYAPAANGQALLAWVNAPLLPPGQFHFGGIDREVALRNGFGFGLSMSSSRIANYENLFSTDDLKGWFTGDGMTYLYLGTTDTHYTSDFWATVDYYHLPGTTSETNATPQPSTTDQDWVGGAQVANQYGVAGISIHPVNNDGSGYLTLVGKKSYFMLDNEIVCLGAGISSADNNVIDTTVENRRLGSSLTNNFWINGRQIPPTIGWSSNLTSVSWCALDGVGGYYFPGGGNNLFATFAANSGSWTAVHPGDSDSSTHTDNYLELYFKHGLHPVNASYAYVLLPNMTATSVSNYAAAPDIIVLTNMPTVQAVSKPSLGVVAANFWTAGTNSVGLITVDNQASVITMQNSNVLSVGISDPTQDNDGAITLTLNQSAASVVSAYPEVTVVQLTPKIILSVDVSYTLGRAIQASFISNSAAVTNSIPPVITSFGVTGASGQFQIQLTGNSNFTQTVLATTNLALPLSNWTVLGVATQISSGIFQFTDLKMTNNVQQYYRLRSP
jgi:hyaluronate lyase